MVFDLSSPLDENKSILLARHALLRFGVARGAGDDPVKEAK